jgi:hypothetical protein
MSICTLVSGATTCGSGLCMSMCMRSESASASHSSPPQLKGVRVISARARARVCAGTISQISLLCLFVCRCPCHKHTHTQTSSTKNTGTYMSCNDRKSFICTGRRKHNRTPTQAHTARYSLHLRHALESVGLHRRYSLRRKIHEISLRGAGACADERCTGVVAAEAAAAEGHCPRYGRARDGALVV